ncbi:hypothetical protein C8R45DRAFT_928445 [Mycena sanguinolenta]|nr:hypothetical protein C8R45DRAFT_928445 [Mycena sanguinolenta]
MQELLPMQLTIKCKTIRKRYRVAVKRGMSTGTYADKSDSKAPQQLRKGSEYIAEKSCTLKIDLSGRKDATASLLGIPQLLFSWLERERGATRKEEERSLQEIAKKSHAAVRARAPNIYSGYPYCSKMRIPDHALVLIAHGTTSENIGSEAFGSEKAALCQDLRLEYEVKLFAPAQVLYMVVQKWMTSQYRRGASDAGTWDLV